MVAYRILYHHRIRADDGQAVHVRELIAALRELGQVVTECALVPKTGDSKVAGVAAKRGGGGGMWTRLTMPRLVTEMMEVAYNVDGLRRLLRAGRELRPDFVYERHALHCRAGLDAARRLGVPLLLEVNSPMCDEMARLGLLRLPRRARRVEREVLGGADLLFPVTRVLADRLVEIGADPERVVVVGNAARPERYDAAAQQRGQRRRVELGIDPAAFVVGFVGYMRAWHRLDLAVDQLARPELAAAHLLLVGAGPVLAAVVEHAAARGLADRVHAVGAVEPAALPELVCSFDAALIPAINSYASPLKLFDSLAAGVATVAPDQPNLRESIEPGHSGLLFQPDDPTALGDCLAELCADRDRTAAIGAAGAASLRQRDWTWNGNARRVLAAFADRCAGAAR